LAKVRPPSDLPDANIEWMDSKVKSRIIAALTAAALASGCTATAITPPKVDARLIEGPPISDVVTPFDQALTCLDGKVSKRVVFSVGAILDQTGKESFTDGGVGKFVTQGAGDMVQSALFKAGATVVNRRDPRVTTTEMEWRIRDASRIIPSNFYITGSINSLDFIPGGGVQAEVAGIGARYRSHRMLVGIDLALTEAHSGRIVANVPLHKQIYANEYGLGLGRFFGSTLASGDIGGREREALHFALRQMLYLATFELLTQVMKAEAYAECRAFIDEGHGKINATSTAKAIAKLESKAKATAVAEEPIPTANNGVPAQDPVPVQQNALPLANGNPPLQQQQWDPARGGWVPKRSGEAGEQL